MTTPNADLAYKVLDQIDAHPELWAQECWVDRVDCGTSYCFAGWALALSGHEFTYSPNDYSMQLDGESVLSHRVIEAACDELGMDDPGEPELFDPDNTREDLGRLVAEVFGPRPEPAS